MSMPIARAGWWTGAQETLPSPPPPKPEHVTADPQPSSPTVQPSQYFTAAPTPTQGPVAPGSVRSLLPADAAKDSEPKTHPVAGLEADDPRTEVIEQGYQVRDIDAKVNALADQQIDIEGAKGEVQAAETKQEQFLRQVMNGLSAQQKRELQPSADAAAAAPDDAAAQEKFGRAFQGILSPEQQQKLILVQRESENALIHLEAQKLGERLVQARSKADQEQLSLVMADARMYVSGVRQVEANRKLQDALAVVMTPETRQKLATPEQKLRDAANKAQSNPNDADAQKAVQTAQKEFDTALASVVSSSDKHALDVLEAAAKREQDLNSLLAQEAQIEHRPSRVI